MPITITLRYSVNNYNSFALYSQQGTPFAQGKFRMKLVLAGDYPASPPKGFFLTRIYHPNVAPDTGSICVNTLKKDWTPDVTLRHVLAVIRCLLIVPFPESSLNEEAGKQFMESYSDFASRARIMTEVHALTPASHSNTGEKQAQSAASGSSGSDIAESSGGLIDTTMLVNQSDKKAKDIKKKGLKRL